MSTCMLFTVSQFLIPLSLQIYYEVYPMNVSLLFVFFMGIFYHNHLLNTRNTPYIYYRLVDMFFVSIASILLLLNSLNNKTILCISTSGFFFYILGNKYNIPYLHSLLHLTSITSSVLIVYHVKNIDFRYIDSLIIMSSSYIGYICYYSSLDFFKQQRLKDKF